MSSFTFRRLPLVPLLLLAALSGPPATWAADSPPLETGIRLLEQDQPVIQWIINDGFNIHAREEEEDLSFSDSSVTVEDRSHTGTRGHAMIMGGCFTTDADGTVRDDRYLLTVESVKDKIRLLRTLPVNGGGTFTAHDAGSISVPNPTSANGTYFLDVASGNFNGDSYLDFAILYPSRKNDDQYQYNLVLVDGKPDGNGYLLCHHDDKWRWTLQEKYDGGPAQGRIATGDLDDDGRDEIAIYTGTQKTDGDKHKLCLAVYDITSDFNRDADSEKTAYTTLSNAKYAPKSCALDVAIGDFRGTGKQEIATVTSAVHTTTTIPMGGVIPTTYEDGHDVTVRIWKLEGDSLKQDTSFAGNHRLVKGSQASTGYVRCDAGDLDGDGMDELVWAGIDYTDHDSIVVAVHDPAWTGSALSFTQKDLIYPLDSDSHAFNMALGYFSQGFIPSDTNYPNRIEIALASRNGGRALMKTIRLNEDDSFSETQTLAYDTSWNRATDYPVVTAGDLTKETLSLGSPLHFIVADQITPLMVLQAPPRHRDLIDSSDYSAFCDDGYYGQMKYHSAEKETAKETDSVSVSSTTKENGSAEYKFFSLVDTKLAATFTQSKKETEDKLKEYSTTTEFDIAATVTNDDWIYYAEQDLEVWRYPILGQAGDTVSGDVTTEELYYQVVYPRPAGHLKNGQETFSCTSATTKEWYAPIHENLNLLSYPTDEEFLADFPKDLARIISVSTTGNVGGSGSQTIQATMTETSAESETATKSVSNSTEVSVTVKGKCFGLSLGTTESAKFDEALTSTSVNGINYSETKSFMVKMPATGFAGEESLYGFDLTPWVYLSDGKGTFTAAYTVDLYGGEGSLWNDWKDSPYWQLPDPALNLPQKWAKPASGIWDLQTSLETRRKIRGGFALQPDDDGNFDNSTPEELLVMDNSSETLRLACRVHNYSFLDCDPVTVKFSYIDVPTRIDSHGRIIAGSPEDGNPIEIGTCTIPGGIDCNNAGSRNWELAWIDWDTSGLEDEGIYWIQVEIDPEDEIDEIHDNGDEIDNNIGWFRLGLVRETTLNRLGESYIESSSNALETSAKTVTTESDIAVMDLTMADTNTAENGTTTVTGVVVNEGEDPAGIIHVYFRGYCPVFFALLFSRQQAHEGLCLIF